MGGMHSIPFMMWIVILLNKKLGFQLLIYTQDVLTVQCICKHVQYECDKPVLAATNIFLAHIQYLG